MARPVKSRTFTPAVRAELRELFRTVEIAKRDMGRFEWYIAKALNGKNYYEGLLKKIAPQMPWWFLACTHGMECGFSFEKHLHNGDPLARRTHLVPAGRPQNQPANGKEYTFAESAADALTMPGKRLHLVNDWSVEHALWLLESFNGLGYRINSKAGIHSPYLWAGTNHYTKGKFVRDGVYSSTAISKQAGCGGLIKLLMEAGK